MRKRKELFFYELKLNINQVSLHLSIGRVREINKKSNLMINARKYKRILSFKNTETS